MGLRGQLIDLGLKQTHEIYSDHPVNIIEIGCMFKEDEGLSTFTLAQFLHDRSAGGRLISIEYDKNHIQACRTILERKNPKLLDIVEFRHGHSLALIDDAIKDLEVIHFASADGGAHPEVCLQEFERLARALADAGLIVIDDAQKLKPTSAYGLPRLFGKATLILPMLIVSQYIQHRDQYLSANASNDGPNSSPNSDFIGFLNSQESVYTKNFELVERGHKMLLYGNTKLVSQLPPYESRLFLAVKRLLSVFR